MKSVLVTIHIDGNYWHPHFIPWEPPINYVKGQLELGAQGSTHWQMYMESKPAISLSTWKRLIMNESVHLESRRGTTKDCINYVTKTESRLHGPETDFEYGTPNPESGDNHDAYKDALNAENFKTAIDIIKTKVPRDFVLFNRQILSTLHAEFTNKWTNNSQALEFNVSKLANNLLTTSAVIINGTSGLGKTQFALSHFSEPVLLSHIDDLKKIVETTDGLVFDDMNFQHWPPNACIHLCDMELPRSINVKYGTKEIPAKMPRIFTTNRDFKELWSKDCTLFEFQAITRRCHVMTVINKLF